MTFTLPDNDVMILIGEQVKHKREIIKQELIQYWTNMNKQYIGSMRKMMLAIDTPEEDHYEYLYYIAVDRDLFNKGVKIMCKDYHSK